MSLDAVILAEMQRRITPIGTLSPFQNVGTEFTDPYSGMTWLRSGVVKSAGSYPLAAAHPATQVFGSSGGSVPNAGSGIYDLATDGAGSYAAAAGGTTTTVIVSVDGGATWSTLEHNLGIQCSSISWDATNSLWLFAGNNGNYIKVATSPNLSTAGTLRFTSGSGSNTENTALVRTSAGNSFVVCNGTYAGYSSNSTAWTQIVNPIGANTPAGLAKLSGLWALTYGTYLFTSSDGGATWGELQSLPSGAGGSLTSGNGVFLLLGGAGSVFTGTTGATGSWTQYSLAGVATGEMIYPSRAFGGYVDGVWRFISQLGIIETADLAKTVIRRIPVDFSAVSPMMAVAAGGKFAVLSGGSGTSFAAYGTSLTTATYVGVPKMSGPSLPNAIGAPYYYARIK